MGSFYLEVIFMSPYLDPKETECSHESNKNHLNKSEPKSSTWRTGSVQAAYSGPEIPLSGTCFALFCVTGTLITSYL